MSVGGTVADPDRPELDGARRGWLIVLVGICLIVAGAFGAYRVQTADGTRVREAAWTTGSGLAMHGLLYVPRNATPASRAPAILLFHGVMNSGEMQGPFAIELARRGYVVLAADMPGHGASDPPAFADKWGGPAAMGYLRSLAMVDPARIGMAGHSLGGAPMLSVAASMPGSYQAMVLVGSSTGKGAEGTPRFPRNVAYVFGRWDEFSRFMWGRDGHAMAASPKLMTTFAASVPVVPDRTYGSVADGTARRLYSVDTTHPGEIFSPTAVADVADWFARTIGQPTPRAPADQIWPVKEASTLAGLIGALALILGAFDVLLRQAPFRRLLRPARGVRSDRQGMTGRVALAALLPAALYMPLCIGAAIVVGTRPAAPQLLTTNLACWAIGSAIVLAIIRRTRRTRPVPGWRSDWPRMTILAMLPVFVAMMALLIVHATTSTDFRFWVVALRLPTLSQFGSMLIYLPAFLVFALLTARGFVLDLTVAGEPTAATYRRAVVALTGGMIVFLLIQYGCLFLLGHIATPFDPLHVVVAIQIVFILAFAAVLLVFTWRRTDSFVPGGLMLALVLVWFCCANTATTTAVPLFSPAASSNAQPEPNPEP